MSEDAVFLVTEVWLKPGTSETFKDYRRKMNNLLEAYRPEYVFHNHAFEWIYGGEGEALPTGMEIVRFENEQTARAAIDILNAGELKSMEDRVFNRVRCYLSRYAPLGETG